MFAPRLGLRLLAPALVILLTPLYYLVSWERTGSAAEWLGLPFLIVYLLALPGVMLYRLLDVHAASRDALERVTGAVLCGLGLFLAAGYVAALSEMSLDTFGRILPLFFVPVIVLDAARRPERGAPEGPAPSPGDRVVVAAFLAVLVLVFVFTLRSGVPVDYTKDTLDHVGYVREIGESGDVYPRTAFYLDPGPNGEDIRKGLLHFFYGFAADGLHIDALRFLSLINAFFAVLVLLAIYSLGVHLFGHKKIAVLAALLFFLGTNGGIAGSMSRSLFYPNRFGLVFFFLFLAYGLQFLEKGSRRDLLPAGFFAFAASAVHVLFIIIHAAAVGVILVWKVCFPETGWRQHLARAVTLGVVAAVALLPCAVYRYLTAFPGESEIHREVQGVVYFTNNLFIGDSLRVRLWLGPIGLLTFFTVLLLWKERSRHAGLGYLIASLLTIPLVLGNPVLIPPLAALMTYLVFRLFAICPYFLLTAYFYVDYFTRLSRGESAGLGRHVLVVVLSIAVLSSLRPFFGENTFSASRLERERGASYTKWKDGLDFLDGGIPERSVIVSDPLTSYSVPAFTSHYVVCTLDQHGPPNDLRLEERIQDARDALSPYIPIERTLELLEEHGATHVVLNNRLPRTMLLHYWSMDKGVYPGSLRKFSSRPQVFERIFEQDEFVVFRWNGATDAVDTVFSNPYVLPELPEAFTPMGVQAGEATLEGFHLERHDVDRGGVLRCGLVWSSDRANRPANYVVSVRFDHTDPELPLGGKPFPKVSRKIKESLVGARYRFRSNHKIRNGFLSPDVWHRGDFVLDETRIRVPTNLVAGRYRVSVKMLIIPHHPSYHFRDILYDDDMYQGVEITRISIH